MDELVSRAYECRTRCRRGPRLVGADRQRADADLPVRADPGLVVDGAGHRSTRAHPLGHALRGQVLCCRPGQRLSYVLQGVADDPPVYLTWLITPDADGCTVRLEVDELDGRATTPTTPGGPCWRGSRSCSPRREAWLSSTMTRTGAGTQQVELLDADDASSSRRPGPRVRLVVGRRARRPRRGARRGPGRRRRSRARGCRPGSADLPGVVSPVDGLGRHPVVARGRCRRRALVRRPVGRGGDRPRARLRRVATARGVRREHGLATLVDHRCSTADPVAVADRPRRPGRQLPGGRRRRGLPGHRHLRRVRDRPARARPRPPQQHRRRRGARRSRQCEQVGAGRDLVRGAAEASSSRAVRRPRAVWSSSPPTCGPATCAGRSEQAPGTVSTRGTVFPAAGGIGVWMPPGTVTLLGRDGDRARATRTPASGTGANPRRVSSIASSTDAVRAGASRSDLRAGPAVTYPGVPDRAERRRRQRARSRAHLGRDGRGVRPRLGSAPVVPRPQRVRRCARAARSRLPADVRRCRGRRRVERRRDLASTGAATARSCGPCSPTVTTSWRRSARAAPPSSPPTRSTTATRTGGRRSPTRSTP